MLRITAEERDRELFLKIEGHLRGRFVDELRLLWDSLRGGGTQPALRVDLAEVDYIDPLGKALLAEMQRNGVEISAHNFVTQAICEEIVADTKGSRKKG
jgi:ABC-type transporter Mla MlaB component